VLNLNDMENDKWFRVNNGPLNMPVYDYLTNIFNEEIKNGYNLKVAVGTDSQGYNTSYKFATVIVIMRQVLLSPNNSIGKGAMIVAKTFYNNKLKKNKTGVKERMLFEVSKSIEIAYKISPLLDMYNIPLEVHADINPDVKWESNKALSEAVGYILGMGYEFRVKPDAWASSSVADNIC
tara:strand:+ start:104 stop:640 length:537 start_codon:yes stop_codon:yes gene_type:complete